MVPAAILNSKSYSFFAFYRLLKEFFLILKLSWDSFAHSFIFDVHDPCWKKIFTPTQLKTIETQGNPPFMNYSTKCKVFFSSLSKVVKSFKKSFRTNTESSISSSTFVRIPNKEEALIVDELWKVVAEYGSIDPKTGYNER